MKHPQASFVNRFIRNFRQKWYRASTAFLPKDRNCDICLRTKITRALCRKHTGNQVPRAENDGDLIAADHKEFSMKSVNLETITSMQSRCKIWLLHGCNRIRAKQNLLRRRKEVYDRLSSRRTGRKSFILTIPWNLAQLLKNYPGIILCASWSHRSETNGIVKREVRSIEEGTSAVLLQSGLDEKWWADSVECYCYLRNVQDWKTPYERRFEETFKGSVTLFESMIEYHPNSAQGPIKTVR